MTRSSRHVFGPLRTLRSLVRLAGAAVLLSCLNDSPLGPASKLVRLGLSTQVVARQAGEVVELRVFYLRTAGEAVTIRDQRIPLEPGTQQLSVTVDVTRCLADPLRVGGTGAGCPLNVTFRLLGATGAVIDSSTVGPFEAAPGETREVPTVTLGRRVTSVVVTPAITRITVGQASQLQAEARDTVGGVIAGRAVVWTSSSVDTATVSEAGLVTAIAAGSATITATVDGRSGTARITVVPLLPVPVASVLVTPPADTLLVGATVQLTAVARDSAGGTLEGRPATWSSSDATRASVDQTGLVRALGAGAVTITARIEAATGTSIITVEPLAAGVRTWVGGAAAGPGNWSLFTNWSPAQVPSTVDTVVIDGSASIFPVLTGPATVAGLRLTGGSIDLGGSSLTVTSLARVSGTVTNGQFVVSGGNAQLAGTFAAVSLNGSAAASLTGSTTVSGPMTLSGTSDVQLSGRRLTVASLATSGSATVTMTNALDTMVVSGSALFQGGNETGRLTAGVMRLGGSVTQARSAADESRTFVSSGSHRVILDGSASQTVSMGTGASAPFNDLVIVNPAGASFAVGATVNRELDIAGTMLVPGTSTVIDVFGPLILRAGGTLNNSGTVRYDATFTNQGGTIIGNAPVTYRGVASVVITPDGATTLVGNSVQFTATLRDSSNAILTGRPVAWTSLDVSNATVTQAGLATATATGTARIVAASESRADTVILTIASGAPASVTKTWVGGSTSGATNWSAADNWSPVGVPSASDTVFVRSTSTYQPVLIANVPVGGVIIETGATLSVGTFTLTANGNVAADGAIIGSGTVALFGSGVTTVRGSLPNVVVQDTVAANGPVTVTGNLTVGGGAVLPGSFNLSGQRVTVGGSFATVGGSAGTLVMQSAADTLDVAGDATFTGGSTAGLLTAGELRVAGGFVGGQGGSTPRFSASGTHRVVLDGTTVQTVLLVGAQQFQHLDIMSPAGASLTNVIVRGDLRVLPSVTAGVAVSGVSPVDGAFTLGAPVALSGLGGLVVGGGFTAVAGSSVTVGAITLNDPSGVANVAGSFSPGTVTFGGTGAARVVRSGLDYQSVVANVPVTLTGPVTTRGNLTVNASAVLTGPLTVTGNLTVGGATGSFNLSGQRVTVGGSFAMVSGSGATLVMQSAADTLDVAGGATFHGGPTTGLLTAGELRVGGTFLTNPGFASRFSASGTHRVVLDGTTAQSVVFGPQEQFQYLDIASPAGASLTNVTVRGDLRVLPSVAAGVAVVGVVVDGAFTLGAPVALSGSGSVVVGGGFTAVAGSSVTVGAITLNDPSGVANVAGSFSPGTVTFGGTGAARVVRSGLDYQSVVANVPVMLTGPVTTRGNLTVNASAVLTGPLTVTGNLTVGGATGSFNLSGQRVTVGGSFAMVSGSGATLVMQSAADTLDVAGGATFQGSPTTGLLTAGELRVGGNFLVNSGFASQFSASGTHRVVLDGTTPQTVVFVGPQQQFQHLLLSNSAAVSFSGSLIPVRGDLDLALGTMNVGAGQTIDIDTDLILRNGTTLNNLGVVRYARTLTNQGATITGNPPVNAP